MITERREVEFRPGKRYLHSFFIGFRENSDQKDPVRKRDGAGVLWEAPCSHGQRRKRQCGMPGACQEVRRAL